MRGPGLIPGRSPPGSKPTHARPKGTSKPRSVRGVTEMPLTTDTAPLCALVYLSDLVRTHGGPATARAEDEGTARLSAAPPGYSGSDHPSRYGWGRSRGQGRDGSM